MPCKECNRDGFILVKGICWTCRRRHQRDNMPKKECECGCGELIPIQTANHKPARYKNGHNPTNSKGGIKLTSKGYRMIRIKNHPFADPQGYVYEHRLIMEKIIGKYLTFNEVVHHINGDRLDNRPENLKVMSRSEHSKLIRYRKVVSIIS